MHTYSNPTGSFGRDDLKKVGKGFDIVSDSIEVRDTRVSFVVIDLYDGLDMPNHYKRMKVVVNPLRRAYVEPLLCTSLAHCERIYKVAPIVCERLGIEFCDSEETANKGYK